MSDLAVSVSGPGSVPVLVPVPLYLCMLMSGSLFLVFVVFLIFGPVSVPVDVRVFVPVPARVFVPVSFIVDVSVYVPLFCLWNVKLRMTS